MESFPSNFYQEPVSHNPFSWTDNTVLRRRIGRSNHLQKIEPGQMLDCLHTVGCNPTHNQVLSVSNCFCLLSLSLSLSCACVYVHI